MDARDSGSRFGTRTDVVVQADDRLRPFDDMHDDEADLTPGFVSQRPLSDALRNCRDVLLVAFDAADNGARQTQWQHRRITFVAVLFGTVAVVFAMLQLSELTRGGLLGQLEIAAAMVAAVSVALGLFGARQVGWLLARHKAECIRRLKYSFLGDPRLWGGNATVVATCVAELEAEVARIQQITRRDLKLVVEEDQLPGEPPSSRDITFGATTVRELANYYRRKRLGIQREYFVARLGQNDRLDRLTRNLTPVLFFGSVIGALLHFVYDLRAGESDNPVLSFALILLATVPAIVGAAVRTIRAAYEFSRNTSRFRAKVVALQHLDERRRIDADSVDSTAVLRDIWYCEESSILSIESGFA